jgi:hypothetical protein
MPYDAKGMAKADQKLRSLGIPLGLEDLGNEPSLGQNTYIPPLSSMLDEPWSTYVKAELIRAICSCSPDRRQRHSTARHALDLLDQHPKPDDDELMFLWANVLNLVDETFLDRIGRMALDPKFGEKGAYCTEALRKMKDPRAVDYIIKASRRENVRTLALQGLSKRDPARALQLTTEYLQGDGGNRDLRRLHAKLIKKLEGYGSRRSAEHRTRAAVPRGLRSWSCNIDGENVPNILRLLARELPGVFDQEGILEVESAVDALELDRRTRFHFPRPGLKDEAGLWLGFLCDDEDAYIIEIAGSPSVMSQLEPKISKLFES